MVQEAFMPDSTANPAGAGATQAGGNVNRRQKSWDMLDQTAIAQAATARHKPTAAQHQVTCRGCVYYICHSDFVLFVIVHWTERVVRTYMSVWPAAKCLMLGTHRLVR